MPPQTEPLPLHFVGGTLGDGVRIDPAGCNVAARIRNTSGARLVDERSIPHLADEDALGLQDIERPAQGAEAYAKLACEITLIRQHGARTPCAGGNPLHQDISHLEMQGPRRKPVGTHNKASPSVPHSPRKSYALPRP